MSNKRASDIASELGKMAMGKRKRQSPEAIEARRKNWETGRRRKAERQAKDKGRGL